jgi:hypothetical protein
VLPSIGSKSLSAARGDLKTSRTGRRTPFQILGDYYKTGDTRDRQLWQEYVRAPRGLAAVRWSRGLRAAIVGLCATCGDLIQLRRWAAHRHRRRVTGTRTP